MLSIQINIEASSVLRDLSMPEMSKKLLTSEPLVRLQVSFQKPFRFPQLSCDDDKLLSLSCYLFSFFMLIIVRFMSLQIKGVGGIMELAPGYLPAVYKIIKKAGGLCIADEVQSGFGRTGTHFWGFENHGVIPDIVTMAKVSSHSVNNYIIDFSYDVALNFDSFLFRQGIGNGIPIGAVITTPEIAQALTRRSYFNTFGGNPVCTAGGHAVLRVLEKEKLQENAFTVGSYLKDRLKELQKKHESK